MNVVSLYQSSDQCYGEGSLAILQSESQMHITESILLLRRQLGSEPFRKFFDNEIENYQIHHRQGEPNDRILIENIVRVAQVLSSKEE